MQEDVVLTLLQGDNRINEVLDKLENEGFSWLSGETLHEGYKPYICKDIRVYLHYKAKKVTYSDLTFIDSNFKDITIDEFLNISNLSFNSIITSTEPLYIEFKDRNKFKRFIMECYMREDDVFSMVNWSIIFEVLCSLIIDYVEEHVVRIDSIKGDVKILYKSEDILTIKYINGDDITYPSISKETINSIISPIIKNGEVIRNYKEIVDVIAKLKEL